MNTTTGLICTLAVCCAAFAGCRQPAERLEWTAMGTVAAVQVRKPPCAAGLGPAHYRDQAKDAFSMVERLLNAHDPDSELSRLATLPEDAILAKCDARVRPCYETAFRLMRESGGAFNPRWKGPGTLDLGAIAKGFAVDLAEESMYAGADDLLLDLGGNLKAVRREGGSGRGWNTGVVAPSGGGIAATVELMPGEALATSAEYFRGRHIYDGRTGSPAESGVASVTVLCESATLADGLSTTLFVLGPEEGLAFMGRNGYKASVFFVMKDGREIRNDARF